jgi:hypothetical protein
VRVPSCGVLPGRRARPGCACAAGTRASWHGGGYSAGTYACSRELQVRIMSSAATPRQAQRTGQPRRGGRTHERYADMRPLVKPAARGTHARGRPRPAAGPAAAGPAAGLRDPPGRHLRSQAVTGLPGDCHRAQQSLFAERVRNATPRLWTAVLGHGLRDPVIANFLLAGGKCPATAQSATCTTCG